MFFTNYMELCARKSILPTVAAREMGLSAASFTGWSNGAIPRRSTLKVIADYFGVTVDELLNELPAQKEKTVPEIEYDLTPDEIELLKLFRASPQAQRVAAYTAALAILKSSLK